MNGGGNPNHDPDDGRFTSGSGVSKDAEFVKEYVKLHNAASKKYKDAFKDVGARMWSGDDAHALKPYNEAAILESVQMSGISWVRAARPLTVLDSHPEVRKSASKMKRLESRVNEIHNEFSVGLARLKARHKHG